MLVLDEPTAALHDEEVAVLKTAIRALTASGAGVMFISHRLSEVAALADRAIVLKNGRVVAERKRGDFDEASLVRLIAGAPVAAAATHQPAPRPRGPCSRFAVSRPGRSTTSRFRCGQANCSASAASWGRGWSN